MWILMAPGSAFPPLVLCGSSWLLDLLFPSCFMWILMAPGSAFPLLFYVNPHGSWICFSPWPQTRYVMCSVSIFTVQLLRFGKKSNLYRASSSISVVFRLPNLCSSLQKVWSSLMYTKSSYYILRSSVCTDSH